MRIGYSISGGLSVYLGGLFLFVIVYFGFMRKRFITIYQKVLFITFYIYLVLVVEKTMMPIPLNVTQIEMWKEAFIGDVSLFNFMPSIEIGNNLWVSNMMLNVIMFVPFGILWPLHKRKISAKFVFISSLIFTCIIEFYQLGMAVTIEAPLWYFDMNDIIANVLGGMIGYLLLKIFSPLLFKRISKNEFYGGL